MITSLRDKRICDMYGKRDNKDKVHCNQCPLRKSTGSWDFRCKANSHYNRSTGEWEYDR
jgi:hypothetical protein